MHTLQKIGTFLVSPLPVLVLLFLLALLIYSNTFSAPFQFDDHQNIVENPQIKSLAGFRDIEGTRYMGFLSFALNYHFGGLNVFGYHLVNVLIHIVNGFLVYWLVVLLFRCSGTASSAPTTPSTIHHSPSTLIPLLTALLFVAHPIQTQAVTYIVQRFASLAALFYLLAVVCYLKWRIGPIRPIGPIYFLSLLSTLLAMKTKENSFTLPVMILLVEMTFFKPRRWKAVIPFFLLAVPIIPLSHQNALGEAEGFIRDTADISRLDYLFTQFRVIVTYLRLLVLPINQTLDYDYPVYHSLFDAPVLGSFVFLTGLVAFAIRQISRIGRIRLIGFGIIWFFLTLSIESSVIPIRDVIFEHRLYLPSVGFFLGMSLAGAWLWQRCQKRKVLSVLFALLVLCALGSLAMATHRRNLVWGSAVTLWGDVVRKAPKKARGHISLGAAYRRKGSLEEAIREFQTALRLNPEYPAGIHNNLGAIYNSQGRREEAIREFQTALQLNPEHPAEIHVDLGVAYYFERDLKEAIREFETALRLKPDYAEAFSNLGSVYAANGDFQKALSAYQTALKLEPGLFKVRYNLGSIYVSAGMLEEARREFEEALRINPDFSPALRALESLPPSQ